jgi:hypothetical protein
MIIVVDGPEKAGKSTLIEALAGELKADVRRWGPVDPDDRVYLEPLKHDCWSDDWTIWDRSWASEHVYSYLLRRNRRLGCDPWMGEWLYGRAVSTVGIKIILLPNAWSELLSRRDETDLPVDPMLEWQAFSDYAARYNWILLANGYTNSSLLNNVERVISMANNFGRVPARPPFYAGPSGAEVVVVGEARSKNFKSAFPGSWLPFTSPLTSELGRRIGRQALNFGWTNVGDVPLSILDGRLVIACGERAAEWLGGSKIPRICIPHPAWMYRYNNSRTLPKRELVDKLFDYLRRKDNE